MGRLSGEDYTELEKLQTVVRTDDGGAGQTRLQIVNLMANHALRSLGIDPTPRPDAPPGSDAAQAARFHHALQDELAAFESRGRKPTEVEAYDIVTGLKDTAIKSGSLKVNGDRAAPTVASDIPSIDDAFHKPGAQLAQAGPEDDKPLRPDSEPSRPGQELRINAERVRQREEEEKTARSAVRGNMTPVEIDRWISDWLSGYRPEDAAPPQMPAGLAERLTAGQRAEIEDIVSGGADTRTDLRVLEEIRRGLRSGDLAERLEWANKPLYRYRPLLSPHDYQQLTIEQAQIDPQTGVANGAVGHPFGTLEQNAALAIELSAARGVGWIYRAGRWVLEKVTGSDDAPAGKDVAPSEGLNAIGVGGGAAKAAAAALSRRGAIDASDGQEEHLRDANTNSGSPIPRDPRQMEETKPAAPSRNRLPEQKAQLEHIFREKSGHLSDTPENRKLLEELANDQEAVRTTDQFGTIWAEKRLPDGRQVWISVRKGIIQNGGINDDPRTAHPNTGLSSPAPRNSRP